MSAHPGSGTNKWSVAIVGAGGNIGSHLAPHIARLACVGRVLLVDHDRYDASNLRSQNIRYRDIGKSKVAVLRRCLSEINPALEVVASSAVRFVAAWNTTANDVDQLIAAAARHCGIS